MTFFPQWNRKGEYLKNIQAPLFNIIIKKKGPGVKMALKKKKIKKKKQ